MIGNSIGTDRCNIKLNTSFIGRSILRSRHQSESNGRADDSSTEHGALTDGLKVHILIETLDTTRVNHSDVVIKLSIENIKHRSIF